jgi:hypothetical protein
MAVYEKDLSNEFSCNGKAVLRRVRGICYYICTMPDTDKILQALKRLENGQKSLQEGQQVLQKTVDQQGKAIAGLQEGQRVLEQGQKSLIERQTTLELKMEAFHTEQRRANSEIITTLHKIVEVNATETEKRVGRIEKHLNLPPVK